MHTNVEGIFHLTIGVQFRFGFWNFENWNFTGLPRQAVLLTLPIAYHCAFAYGVQTHVDTRVAVHSIAGCSFYGAFAAKLIVVRSRWLPGYALPLAGGILVTVVAVLWYTSALWNFNDFSLP